jgi:hypothetical protein
MRQTVKDDSPVVCEKAVKLITASRKMSRVATAAKQIRERLKKSFPGTKFYVTSKSYSMGDSINISYTDGPASALVEAIAFEHQMGNYDHTDCYT